MDSEISQATFWDDQERAQKILKERSRVQGEIEDWENKEKELEEILILSDFVKETGDQNDVEELVLRVKSLDESLEVYEIQRMFSGENDDSNAIVYINSGAGGTEAQDWVEILLRMYLKWAERKGFETQIADLLPEKRQG